VTGTDATLMAPYAPLAEAGASRFPDQPQPQIRPRIDLQPGDISQGLGKLVLTVVELLRQLLEKQAQRRVESGELGEEEVERLGLTFLRLSEQMDEMKRTLGLEGEELNLDLGPLGSLL
jgi:hypothetical protein